MTLSGEAIKVLFLGAFCLTVLHLLGFGDVANAFIAVLAAISTAIFVPRLFFSRG